MYVFVFIPARADEDFLAQGVAECSCMLQGAAVSEYRGSRCFCRCAGTVSLS